MNDFVMSVVNEVLQKQGSKDTGNVSSGKEEIEFERPNYQRQKAGKKLMVYEIPSDQTSSMNVVQNSIPGLQMKRMEAGTCLGSTKQPVHPYKPWLIDDTAIIAQTRINYKPHEYENPDVMNKPGKTEIPYTAQKLRPADKEGTTECPGRDDNSDLINQSSRIGDRKTSPYKNAVKKTTADLENDNNFSSFSIEDNPKLSRLIGFPYSHRKAACIGMQEGCFINQIFAVDEILRQFPSLDFTVKWSGNRQDTFTFQAIGTMDMMETVQDLLNRNCTERKEIRLVRQPTPYLQKLLNFSSDTIGTVEGVWYTRLIHQAADYFRQNPDCMVECHIFGRYLIFGGEYSQVQAILQNMSI